MSKPSGIQKLLLQLGLTAIPILLFYILFEAFVFRPLVPHLPLRSHQYLPEPLRMIAESSKRGVMPRHYTLILGDSYADGWGDWLQAARPGHNDPYGSHDLLYRLTGQDTVHSGFAGGSPTETLVRKPVNRFRYLRKMLLYRPEDPERILVYFYEGNDLIDDLQRLSGPYKDHVDLQQIRNPHYFRSFLENEVLKSDALYYDVRHFRLHYQCLSLEFAANILTQIHKPAAPATPPPAAAPGTNRFRSHGRSIVFNCGYFLSPPLNYTREELDLSEYVAGASLDYLRSFFPKSQVIVVYIPAPSSCYPMMSSKLTVQRQNDDNPQVVDRTAIEAAARENFLRVERIARERGLQLIDTRADFRRAAWKFGLLHGPKDYYHLNQKGYEVLAQSITRQLGFPPKSSSSTDSVQSANL